MLAMVGSFFFFSSRRRHTRYWRDWSSDVCSSDLEHSPFMSTETENALISANRDRAVPTEGTEYRSEERRVGKECRYRSLAYHEKKKRIEPDSDSPSTLNRFTLYTVRQMRFSAFSV